MTHNFKLYIYNIHSDLRERESVQALRNAVACMLASAALDLGDVIVFPFVKLQNGYFDLLFSK